MAESAVSFILNKLEYEYTLLGTLWPDVMYIKYELGHMKAFLRVADSQEDNDPQLMEWVRQVREIAYDIEDAMDEYMVRFANPNVNGIGGRIKKFYALIRNLIPRHQIASEFQKIKSRVEYASQGYQRYKDMFSVMDQGTSSIQLRKSCYDGRGDALLLENADVVGLENPKKQLCQWIFSIHQGLRVISVVGMGGLGKTTLVKKVFDDKSVIKKFDHNLWITISESFDIENILRSMIKSLVEDVKQAVPQEFNSMTADKMREFIYRFLLHKNYLVVLDDVWKIDVWEAIRYAFPRSTSEACGWILITTRFKSIANATARETDGHVYILKPLAVEESKQLFYKKTFQGSFCPPHLEKISDSILDRCKGLPLAIVVIGALLATKNKNVEEWEMFSRGLGDELEGGKLNRLKKIISLSFYDLPYYLKSCFLYLSIFPEDAIFERWTLVRLWIAAGYVQEKPGKTLEEVAESYLNELVNRSLIQVDPSRRTEISFEFRMHDLLREYIISKSREEIIVAGTRGNCKWHDKIRRAALDDSLNDIHESCKLGSLRSLLWFGSSDSTCAGILSNVLSRGCRLLKEIDLRGAPVKMIPDEVFKLYHLKYLGLRFTMVKFIPKSIKHLHNLETLDLKGCQTVQLPIEVLKLHKLRHLLVESYGTDGIIGVTFDQEHGYNAENEIGHLLSLQRLACLNAYEIDGVNTVTEIGKLTQLRKLGLTKLKKQHGKDLCSSLAKLNNLRSLILCSNKKDEIIDLQHFSPSFTFPFLLALKLNGRLEKIPQWISSLAGLNRLDLRWSRLRDGKNLLDHLQYLPNLLTLFMECAYEGEELNFKVGCFQKLNKLILRSLGKLRRIRVEMGSMPHLEELGMECCELIIDVPDGVEHLSKLQYASFLEMSKEFMDELVAHRSKGKLKHVPKVAVSYFVDGDWKGEFL